MVCTTIIWDNAGSQYMDAQLAAAPHLLQEYCRRLVGDVILSDGVWDRLEAAGICLLLLVVADLQRFVACVGARVWGVQISAEGQARVGAVLQDLMEPELMAQAFRSGFSERGARVRFNSI